MVGVVTSSLTRTGENCLLDMIICLRQGQRESLYCKEILGTEHISSQMLIVDAERLVGFVSVETDTKSGTGCDDNQTDIQAFQQLPTCFIFYLLDLSWLDLMTETRRDLGSLSVL